MIIRQVAYFLGLPVNALIFTILVLRVYVRFIHVMFIESCKYSNGTCYVTLK